MRSWMMILFALLPGCKPDLSDPHDYFQDLPSSTEITLVGLEAQHDAWVESGHKDVSHCSQIWKIIVTPAYFREFTGQKSCYDPERIANNEPKCLYGLTRLGVYPAFMFYVRPDQDYSWGKPEDETLAHEAMHNFRFCSGDMTGDVNHTDQTIWHGAMDKLFPND